MVKPLWLQDGPCYWCESGQKLFVGEPVAAKLRNMGRHRYTGENAGCELCTNLRHSPAFIEFVRFMYLCKTSMLFLTCIWHALKAVLILVVCSLQGQCSPSLPTSVLHFKPNADLFRSNRWIAGLTQVYIRQARKLAELNSYPSRSNTVSYSITSVADTVSIVANRGSQKIRFHVSIPLVTGSKAD